MTEYADSETGLLTRVWWNASGSRLPPARCQAKNRNSVARCLDVPHLDNTPFSHPTSGSGKSDRPEKKTRPQLGWWSTHIHNAKALAGPVSVYILIRTPFSSTIPGIAPANHEYVLKSSPYQLQSFFELLPSLSRQDSFAAVSRAPSSSLL